MKLNELTNRDASWDVVEILTTMDSIPKRSITYQGIANAMADQWGRVMLMNN